LTTSGGGTGRMWYTETMQLRKESHQRIMESVDRIVRNNETVRNAANSLWEAHTRQYRTVEMAVNID
jgi:hypothetical protein